MSSRAKEEQLHAIAEGIERVFSEIRGVRKIEITQGKVTVYGDFDITGDVTANNISASAMTASSSVTVDDGVTSTELTPDRQEVTDTQSTWIEAQQSGAARREHVLNSTPGLAPTFTTTEDALRIRYNFNSYGVYAGDNVNSLTGDPVTWDPVMIITPNVAGHTVSFSADVTADNIAGDAIDGTTITASTALVSDTIQQNNLGGSVTVHNSNVNNVAGGSAMHQRVFQNNGNTAGVMFFVKGAGANDGYWRFDPWIGGVSQTGTLTVGSGSNAYVGIKTSSPQYPLDVNGDARTRKSMVFSQTDVNAAPNNSMTLHTDGKFYLKNGAGQIKLIITNPVQ